MTAPSGAREKRERLTRAQLSALVEISRQERASPYSAKASVSTFVALERKGLIRVETTFGSIAFPRNAEAILTDAGRAALKGSAS